MALELIRPPVFPLLIVLISHLIRKTRPTITKTQKTIIKIIPNQPIPQLPIIPGPIMQLSNFSCWAEA